MSSEDASVSEIKPVESSGPAIQNSATAQITPADAIATDPNHPPVDKRELTGWYVMCMVRLSGMSASPVSSSALLPNMCVFFCFFRYMFDWANSAVSSVVISGFLPLLVQECALAAAGFPEVW